MLLGNIGFFIEHDMESGTLVTKPSYEPRRTGRMIPLAHPAPEEKSSCWSPGTLLLTASIVAAVAVAASPFLLPAVGVGEEALSDALKICTTGAPSGIAGASAYLLSYVPYVGETLSQGGVWNAVASGTIGIAGLAAGRFWEQNATDECSKKWAKAFRVGALATSALVALPAILPAISMGIVFLSTLLGEGGIFSEAALESLHFTTNVTGKLGEEGVMAATGSGLAFSSLLLPHLLSCGVGGLLAMGSVYHAAHNNNDDVTPHQVDEVVTKIPAERFDNAVSFAAREQLKRQYGLADNEMGQAAAR